MSCIHLLPDDILASILSWLTAKDIVRIRYVCKFWYTICTNPSFVQLHLNHAIENNKFSLMIKAPKGLYSVEDYCDSSSSSACFEASKVDYPFKTSKHDVIILGSVNGLLCINPAENVICIWNPSTQESKILPSEEVAHTNGMCSFSTPTYGFGYDCSIEDYKLIKVVRFVDCKHGDGYNVSVYSLKSNSWRTIINTLSYRRYSELPGVFVNGALHWLATRLRSIASIVYFDVGDEIFAEVPLPPHLDHDSYGNIVSVGVFGGCLSMLTHNCFTDRICVYVMKEYQVKESWAKLYTISVTKTVLFRSFHDLKLISSLKNGELLFEKDHSAFVSYNPNAESARIVKINGVRKKIVTKAFMGSLISLNIV